MRFRLVIALVAGLAVFPACRRQNAGLLTPQQSNPTIAKSENPDYEIAEIVLRHLFENNGSGTQGEALRNLKTCWISACFVNFKDMVDYGFSPESKQSHTTPGDFLDRFHDLRFPLQPTPSCDRFSYGGVIGRGGDESKSIVFYIRGLVGKTEDSVIVVAGFWVHPLDAGEYEYTLKRSNSRWIIEKVEIIHFS